MPIYDFAVVDQQVGKSKIIRHRYVSNEFVEEFYNVAEAEHTAVSSITAVSGRWRNVQ